MRPVLSLLNILSLLNAPGKYLLFLLNIIIFILNVPLYFLKYKISRYIEKIELYKNLVDISLCTAYGW
jgi:hypothetical protein